jgi:CDP-diacylglycerol--glycerol-3-phosphate 3-phosphatidyltransferase
MSASDTFQHKMDVLIDKVFLWAIPRYIKPNHLTYFRIATIPVIFLLMYQDRYALACIVFVVSASTDFLDGATARTRNQITNLGKIIDPIADKMLIAALLYAVGFQYLMVKIFLVFILLEIVTVISGAVLSFRFGRPIGANVYGKIKMVLQTVCVFTFLLGVALSKNILINISIYMLVVALIFAVLAGIEVYRTKHNNIMTGIKKILRI